MNYEKFFSDELKSLKSQGLYRKFREINRTRSTFPKATERDGDSRRQVEVWCSNDYLNLSQHPAIVNETIKVTQELGPAPAVLETFLVLPLTMRTLKER